MDSFFKGVKRYIVSRKTRARFRRGPMGPRPQASHQTRRGVEARRAKETKEKIMEIGGWKKVRWMKKNFRRPFFLLIDFSGAPGLPLPKSGAA
jgi:hypothetical protein